MANLIVFIFRGSRWALIVAIVAGMSSGLSGVALLALINKALQDPTSNILWPLFVELCVIFLAARFVSEYILTFLGQNAVRDLRLKLSRDILALPFSALQKLGPGKVLANMTEDISAIAEAFVRIPSICVNFAVIIGCIIYLGWLSMELLWIVLCAMLFGVWIFRAIQFLAHRRLVAARDHEDSVHQYFRNMTDGIKELKLNRLRRQAFLSDCVEASVLNCRQSRLSASLLYVAAINWGNGLFYVVIGTILFIVPVWQEIPPETARGYSLVILYMTMPLPLLLESLPSFAKAGISLRKIQLLDKDITQHPQEGGSILSIEERRPKPVLELSQIRYCYYGGEGRCEFALGPIDITLYPGELVFLIGGNGSGKSTLALLLVGLYSPESGAIRLGGKTITEENVEYYRQQFSVVFVDFFLFETLLGLDDLEGNGKAREYLKLLDLHHKVSIKDGKFSSLNLSQGQRKRLALLVAYLEDRQFYVFDEWAADQDPVFKNVFYTELLPSLKSRGKTVIVITHDDTYFSVADRCLKLRDGKLLEVPMVNASYRYGKPDRKGGDNVVQRNQQ